MSNSFLKFNLLAGICFVSFSSLSADGFTPIYPDIQHRENSSANGERTNLSYNSWQYKSHTDANMNCNTNIILGKRSNCRKVDSKYRDENRWVKGRETKYSFDLRVDNFPGSPETAPSHVIIFQDWVKLNPHSKGDSGAAIGNPPITTLKLKRGPGGNVDLSLHNNTWQFSHYDVANYQNYRFIDYKHADGSWDEEELYSWPLYWDDKNAPLWKIEITIKDGNTLSTGGVTLKKDGRIIAEHEYQTKAPAFSNSQLQTIKATDPNAITSNFIQWGLYWSKEFNSNALYFPYKRIDIGIENLIIEEKTIL